MSIPKIGENTTNILNFLFFIINLHSVTWNQISTYRKLNLSQTGSICFFFLALEIQKRLDQTKINHAFSYFVWKEMTHKPLKVAATKNPLLQCVWYYWNLLRWMFFILCDNLKILLFMKVWRYSEIFFKRYVVAFFDDRVSKEFRILYVIFIITIPKFQNKADYPF